jgi:hypothetical protein
MTNHPGKPSRRGLPLAVLMRETGIILGIRLALSALSRKKLREPLRQAISTLFESLPEEMETCTRLNIGAKLSKRRQTEAIEMLSLRLGITLCCTSQEIRCLKFGQTVGHRLLSMDTGGHPEPKSG